MKRRDILIILASVFIFVFIWIGFNIYHNSIKSTITETVSIQISSISPNFDTSAIDKLKKRQIVTPVFQSNGAVQTTPNLDQETVAPVINSSGSATQSTSGASLLP